MKLLDTNSIKGKMPMNKSNHIHQGNVRAVISQNGALEEVNAYYPYGGLLGAPAIGVQARKYGGKELDRENALDWLDFEARMYDPMLPRFTSIDPESEKTPNNSSYSYCANNPVNRIDPNGKRILFVNGYWNSLFGGLIGSDKPYQDYWGFGFVESAQDFFNDYSTISENNFIDGSSLLGIDMSGLERYIAGYLYVLNNIHSVTSGLKKGESFNMVTHSEGAAYGAGVAQALINKGYTVKSILHLSADEGDEFITPEEPYTLQLSYQGDWVTNNHIIKGVDKSGEIAKGNLSFLHVHGITRNASIFKAAKDLKTVMYRDNIGMINGKASSWKSQIKETIYYGTVFYIINGYKMK